MAFPTWSTISVSEAGLFSLGAYGIRVFGLIAPPYATKLLSRCISRTGLRRNAAGLPLSLNPRSCGNSVTDNASSHALHKEFNWGGSKDIRARRRDAVFF